MNFKKTMLASLLMISASGAFAAEMTITGKLVAGTCDVTFTTDGGKIDYLDIPVSGDSGITLPNKDMGYSIVCDPGSAVKFSFADGKPGTSTGMTNTLGLGEHDGAKIGSYRINTRQVTGDNQPVGVMSRAVGAPTWGDAVAVSGDLYFRNASSETSFGPIGSKTPTIYSNVSGVIQVNDVQIAPGLPISEGVTLDGSAIMTVTQI